MMFEVGKEYQIKMNEGDGYSTAIWKVEAVDMPLIKITREHTSAQILNTASLVFVSAEEYVRDLEAERAWASILSRGEVEGDRNQ